ncbi:head-tail connector protein [Paracoccus salipaludis]|uniref:Phage gp6-like head-tail connector protein n=1 Tax=Paracoccus salipaludis TaxID=2032623 RepID=A0A2A2GIH2_9RHOB|nr:head-tail connector protein [Paracoccus salipaludis]PAU96699.1 hypothetical protein CK240_12415 [Paracoccus salipaludis]
MTYTRTPTLASPVSLDDAKQHVRVLADDDDLLIQKYVLAAAREIEAYCEIALTRQTISLTVLAEGEADIIALPVGPLASDAEVTINGVPAGTVTGRMWPSITLPTGTTGHVVISYDAGFGDDARSVPDDLQLAIMEQAAFTYDNRGSMDVKPGLVPAAARIAARYKRVRL